MNKIPKFRIIVEHYSNGRKGYFIQRRWFFMWCDINILQHDNSFYWHKRKCEYLTKKEAEEILNSHINFLRNQPKLLKTEVVKEDGNQI